MKSNRIPEFQRMAVWRRQMLTLKRMAQYKPRYTWKWKEVGWLNGGRNGSCRRWDFRSLDFAVKIRRGLQLGVDG